MISGDLLVRKFPVGSRVKLIESRYAEEQLVDFGLKTGSVGTITGHDADFSAIIVRWDESDSNMGLIFGYDRFSLVFGR